MMVFDDPDHRSSSASGDVDASSRAFLSGAELDGFGGESSSEASLSDNRPLSGIARGTLVFPVDLSDADELAMRASGSGDDAERQQPPSLHWDVYVCQSKPCKERGAGATLDAFVGLVRPGGTVTVHPAILSRAKGKGPVVRCIARVEEYELHGGGEDGAPAKDDGKVRAFEVQNVDSVDKVYRILTKHMDIEGIDSSAAECLKHNYEGNAHLERGELSRAIESYDRAVATGYAPQEGVVLLMRSTAYLKRAFRHQSELKMAVSDLAEAVPRKGSVAALYGVASAHPSLAVSAFHRVAAECKSQDAKFRRIKYRHGLYEYALLRAARDALRSTQLLPTYAKTWLRAGDALAELRKLREAAQYYERAMELDGELAETLRPVVERLGRSQDFLDRARTNGWSEDTLRLALDVAG